MKVIKTGGLTCSVVHQLEIQVEGPPLATFPADQPVQLWWDDCKTTRKINQEAV